VIGGLRNEYFGSSLFQAGHGSGDWRVESAGLEVGGGSIVTGVAESANNADLCENSFAPTVD